MNLAQLVLRSIQFIWILLVTALIGNVLAGKTDTNSTVNYSMFVAAFCWVVWFYGIFALFIESIAIPVILLITDTLATIFTFVAGVVLAKKLSGAHSCNNDAYTHTNSITRGGHSPTKRCRELQASCAFFWFLFATFIGSIIATALSGMGGFRGGMRRQRPAAPAMTQVRA